MNSDVIKIKSNPPNLFKRIYSVWFRHYKVYTKNLISNGFPVFLEPLFFLLAIGLGLGKYILDMGGVNYISFLASAIMIPPAMFTASYECTFGTFIRLEFEKIYDGMLSSSISAKDLIIGEILFSGTKGFFFSACVLSVVSAFGLVPMPMALLVPFAGFLTGLMFSSLSLIITSFVTNINHFNFYFTGFLTPLFFFSGMIFPVSDLPDNIEWLAYILPLSHPINIARAICFNKFSINFLFSLLYIFGFILIFGFAAVKRIEKRLID
ncbi:MAG: ABC transporter permease [Spirochaetes bacterium]|nr:ABC transporter permease [Spirochaetota bacterium]